MKYSLQGTIFRNSSNGLVQVFEQCAVEIWAAKQPKYLFMTKPDGSFLETSDGLKPLYDALPDLSDITVAVEGYGKAFIQQGFDKIQLNRGPGQELGYMEVVIVVSVEREEEES